MLLLQENSLVTRHPTDPVFATRHDTPLLPTHLPLSSCSTFLKLRKKEMMMRLCCKKQALFHPNA